ncbi:uncharacterized protein TRUGW13939_02433 [Talaromyces rugulosus]|uniref:Uncharacterized protein n=1 Tax=Talaromyces rugulosus TaxID=121627 RepID=A0A7H8QPF1_TALRU|nr:uncharacterized protein TRUGW13939_02433 [Talaromyces rugulosus]QKX55341.1 hypothetical protein TRUGW13939_02433 [Talaromyces rugulosus]
MSSPTRQTTGIPKIDAEVAEILKLTKRTQEINLEDRFPDCDIRSENGQAVTVNIVGAGWHLASQAMAIAAAGAKSSAYDMNKDKIGLGQVGSTRLDDVFGLLGCINVCELMPRFTPKQLERLPSIITKITKDTDYENLMKKSDRAKQFLKEWEGVFEDGVKAYASDDTIPKVSKPEAIAMREKIVGLLDAAGLLQITNQEITMRVMEPWLAEDKPVLMVTGQQVNLKKLGLDHLDGTPGFLKEFLLHSSETKRLIGIISKMQENYKRENDTRPSVAVIGGGMSALNCAMDLLEKVEPKDLELVWISPEEKGSTTSDFIKTAQDIMDYKYIPGYVSELVMSQKERRIKSVKVIGWSHDKAQDIIHCDLLIHTWNQALSACTEKNTATTDAFEKATGLITKLLDEEDPENGLVRDIGIFPYGSLGEITHRIAEPWTADLKDDEVLKKQIQKLVKRQDVEEVTIVVTGSGALTRAALFLAQSLQYRGRFIQVAVKGRDSTVDRGKEMQEKLKNRTNWVDIKGRVVRDGTKFENGKFSLGVHNEKGEKIQGVPVVDAIINGAGRTPRIPLIETMLEKGYIGEDENGGLYSNHPTLAGHPHIFNEKPGAGELLPSTSTTVPPLWPNDDAAVRRLLPPYGWAEAFEFAREMMTK